MKPIVDFISDDQLYEVAFTVHLNRVTLLLTTSTDPNTFCDPDMHQQVKYTTQMLWDLLRKSDYSMRRRFAQRVANKPQLVSFILEALCTCCLLYTSPSPRDATLSRMPSSA